jgi:hypothetical protein
MTSLTTQFLQKACDWLQREISSLENTTSNGGDAKEWGVLATHFWLQGGSSRTHRPRTASEAELQRHTDASRLQYAYKGTFHGHLSEMVRRLEEESLKLGHHKQMKVQPGVPSRCGPKEFSLTELQRSAQQFFGPGCPAPMRRVMVELTPGMGKTCVYMEVIAKFLGRVNPETSEYFDIIVLGDEEVFKAFLSMSRCPASVDIKSIERYNEEHDATQADGVKIKRSVLYHRGRDRAPEDLPKEVSGDGRHVFLRNVNPSGGKSLCSLNTVMDREDKKTSRAKAASKKKETSPFEFERCPDDNLIWRGTRVIFMPYALAAKWVVFSNQGIPLWKDDKMTAPVTNATATHAFVEFADTKERVGKISQPKQLGELLRSKSGKKSKYNLPGLKIASSNTVFIIDEVQNLATPSEWKHDHAKPFSPALSEAIWRHTGDFCDEKMEHCDEGGGRQSTPYVFAGTATPNTGTNPESTICILQLLNGKQRPELFIPRWAEARASPGSTPEPTYGSLKPRTLQEFRDLLKDKDAAASTTLYWPSWSERRAADLIVLPRTFLEKSSGFVRDMTSPGFNSAAFPLLQPTVENGRVIRWSYNMNVYTYKDAMSKIIREKLLQQETEDASNKPTYLEHHLSEKANKTQIHDLAYKGFVCAARKEDLQHQASRIYKPVYDELNRYFLQDMVASRVFTANSYFDYRVYPEVDPTNLTGDLGRPLTRTVNPRKLLRCLPRVQKPSHSYAPDVSVAKTPAEPPRVSAERIYPYAIVFTEGQVVAKHYPWYLPSDAANTFIKALKSRHDHSDYQSCRWSEWSLCSDLRGMKDLVGELFRFYAAHEHIVNLDLENRLRDFVGKYCPKLVAAADDMYAHPPSGGDAFLSDQNIFAPGLSSEGKSFFFLNASSNETLNNNYFIVLSSFYFRMRCRPYLQKLYSGQRKKLLPREYQQSGVTLQHRIAWLDALLFRGSNYSWLKTRKRVEKQVQEEMEEQERTQPESAKESGRPAWIRELKWRGEDFPYWGKTPEPSDNECIYPPWNPCCETKDDPPDKTKWSNFWKTWFKGYGMARSRFLDDRLDAIQKSLGEPPSPGHPVSGAAGRKVSSPGLQSGTSSSTLAGATKSPKDAFLDRHKLLVKKIQDHDEILKKAKLDQLEPEEISRIKRAAPKRTFLMKQQEARKRASSALKAHEEASFYVPAIFAVGDASGNYVEMKRTHQKLHFLFKAVLGGNELGNLAAALGRDKIEERTMSGGKKGLALVLDDVLELLGSPGLRSAMVDCMDNEPCVKMRNRGHRSQAAPDSSQPSGFPKESTAGQSMVFAGLAAHKALDFKCTGLNVAFGPQPRGQRIQEMGRNWRTCVDIPYVSIRQIFLTGEDEVLQHDLLLDSYYQAQNEVLDWMRIITISAGLGCSLWWGYSQWTTLLESYKNLRPRETEWFFGSGNRPCLDAGRDTSLKHWAKSLAPRVLKDTPFWRCQRTNITGSMFRSDVSPTRDYGRIVRSPVGAFSPDEIVSENKPTAHHIPDPSCDDGSAVENNFIKEARRKYCLRPSEARALDERKGPAKAAPPNIKYAHLFKKRPSVVAQP